MLSRIEGLSRFEDAVGDMDEFSHHGADDEHRRLAVSGQALAKELVSVPDAHPAWQIEPTEPVEPWRQHLAWRPRLDAHHWINWPADHLQCPRDRVQLFRTAWQPVTIPAPPQFQQCIRDCFLVPARAMGLFILAQDDSICGRAPGCPHRAWVAVWRKAIDMIKKLHLIISAMVAVAAAGAPVHAEVNKCKGPDGKVVYQDMPCEAGVGQELNIRTTPSAQPGEASSKPAIQPPAQPSKASVLRAEQDERAAKLTELNAKDREFRYKDCVNRKELIKSRARACQLGACPNLAIAENEVRFLKMYGAGLPDDCETLNPNRGRGDEVVRQGLRISLEAPLRKGACRPGAYKELTQMTERKSQTMRVWLSS